MRQLEDRNYDLEVSKQELEESRERFRSLVESTSDWVWEVDRQGVYTYASPKVKDLLGYEPHEVVGKSPFDLMIDDERERVAEHFQEAARNRAPLERLENTCLHRDGRKVVLETSGVPMIGSDGELLGYRGIDRDITGQHDLQAQLLQAKKMEAIGLLAGGVAHDFNNLLTPILGYVDLLLMRTRRGDPSREELELIRTAALHGQDLTRQILAFSRQQMLEMRVISLGQVVRAAVRTLKRTIREDIELTTSIGETEDLIRADVTQIEQVLLNFSVNSQDAMPQGGRITIRVSRVQPDDALPDASIEHDLGDVVRLEFSDTGSGMRPETLKKVFDPFFTTKDKDRGTGLGLATVYAIVEQHDGRLSVDSTPGEGTTFTIDFPASAEDSAGINDDPTDAEGPRSATILVVEDEPMVREVVCKLLRAHGYTVHSAENAERCLELVRNELPEFDLLITDVIMPKTNGKELHQQLTEEVGDVRVLFMSGYPENVIASQGVLDGETNFLQKPISAGTLIPKLRKILEG